MKITQESDGFPAQELADLGGDPDDPEGATPEPDCCDVDEDTPPIDRANDTGASFIFQEPVAGTLTPVQEAVDSGDAAGYDVDLPSLATEGNLLIAVVTVRSLHTAPDSNLVDDFGFVAVDDLADSGAAENGGVSQLLWKIADGTEQNFHVTFGSGQSRRIYIAEFDGSAVFDDSVNSYDESSGTSGTVASLIIAGSALLIDVFNIKRSVGAVGDVTLGDSFTEIDDGHVGGSSEKPVHTVGYRNVTAGTYQGSWSTAATQSGYGGLLASFVFPTEEESWVPGGEVAIDDDDTTCVSIDGPNVMRIDLGAPFPITDVRLLFATIPAGAKSYTLKAANEADFSDEVTVATLAFTATGTNDEVVEAFADEQDYQFWELTGPDEVRELCTFELNQTFTPLGGSMAVSEDGTPVSTSATELDFQHGLDVTDAGGGVVEIDVDESELTHNSLAGLTIGDPHTQYRLESADHSHQSTGLQAGQLDHGAALTGLTDDDHTQYIPITTGAVRFLDHGAAGAAETIDLAVANVHRLTLDANCTLTLTGAAATRGGSPASCSVVIEFLQNGTGGWDLVWPGSVDFAGADDQPDQTAGVLSVFGLQTDDGGTTWLAFRLGGATGGGTPATTVTDETDWAILPAVGTDTEYARQDHTHGTPADPSISPASSVEDETTWGITPAVGTDLSYARQDHTHGTPTEPSGGGMGALLLSSDHGGPIVFDDILQASDYSDLLYASE